MKFPLKSGKKCVKMPVDILEKKVYNSKQATMWEYIVVQFQSHHNVVINEMQVTNLVKDTISVKPQFENTLGYNSSQTKIDSKWG